MSSGETPRQNPPTNKSSKKDHTHYLICSLILLEIGSMSAWCIEGVKFINSGRREVDMKYAPQMVGSYLGGDHPSKLGCRVLGGPERRCRQSVSSSSAHTKRESLGCMLGQESAWPLGGYVRAFIERSRWSAEIKDLDFKVCKPYTVEVHNQR